MVVSGGNVPVGRRFHRLAARLRPLLPRLTPAALGIDARPLAVAILLALSSALVAVDPTYTPANLGREEAEARDMASSLDDLWSAFPLGLDPVTALGPASDWLFEPSHEGTPRLRQAPTDAADLFGRLLAPAAERLPIPDAPEGQEPLLSALQPAQDIAPGELAALRAQIAALRLVPDAERALARLVLAYTQATELEALTEGLEPAEAAQERLRATDLLVRTIEQVKGPLALPPAPLDAAQEIPSPGFASSGEVVASAGQEGAWDLLRRVMSATGGRPRDSTLPPLPRESLPHALAGLAATLGAPASSNLAVPELPPSLADAVARIVTARRVGLESGDATIHSLLLLEATRESEPTLRTWGALMALDANAFDPGNLPVENLDGIAQQALSPATASPAQLLTEAHGRPAPAPSLRQPLAGLLERQGVDPTTSLQATASLPPGVAAALAMTLAAADSLAAQSLGTGTLEGDLVLRQTPEVADLLAQPRWSQEEAAFVLAWAKTMDAAQRTSPVLVDAQAEALATVEAAALALHRPFADPWPAAKADDGRRGRSLLGRAADFLSEFQVIGTARAQPLPAAIGCPEASPLSSCEDDVWLYSGQGGGVLVTGYGETTVGTNAVGSLRYDSSPRVIIDLGGDDHYLVAAGAVDPATSSSMRASILIDLGGDDHYESRQAFAHGSAWGRGTLGILWDSDGDDRYEHVGDPEAPQNLAQGAGDMGGVGVLFDGGGNDRYEATRALGQGAAQGSPLRMMPKDKDASDYLVFPGAVLAYAGGLGGTGILLDRGAGDDSFRAKAGQGHAKGGGAFGVLANEQGRSTYATINNDRTFQGGVADGAVGSVAALIDLGGRGTQYSNPIVPETKLGQFRNHESESTPRWQRQDDALWIALGGHPGLANVTTAIADTPVSAGFGLDSSLQDEDNSPVPTPNVVELAFGTDPHDAGDEPGASSAGDALGDALRILSDFVSDPPGVEDLPGLADDLAGLLTDLLRVDLVRVPAQPLFYRYERANGGRCLDGEGGQPVSLLLLSGSQDKAIGERAHIVIDLGGNTTYSDEVAGPGDFCLTGQQGSPNLNFTGVGSYALDVGGNDRYHTPELDRTQGAIAGRVQNNTQSQAVNPLRTTPPVSMLVDLQGNDSYAARERSQGSAFVEDAFFVANGGNCGTVSNGAAWLLDAAGADTYTSRKSSQGSATDSGTGALIDLGGDDAYTFDTQGADQNDGPCKDGAPVLPRQALFLDLGGKDRYTGTRALMGESHAESLEHQGWARSGQSVSAFFVDLGADQDIYTVPSRLGPIVDVSALKNDQRNQVLTGPRRAFLDNPTFDLGPEDGDGDGAPNVIETLFQTDRRNYAENPGAAWGTARHAEDHLDDPTGAPQDNNLTGTEGGAPWFEIRRRSEASGPPASGYFSRLTIGGRGASRYAGEAPSFLVDLGGDDQYASSELAGSRAPATGAVHGNTVQLKLVLDVGNGNDSYAPASGPSLGAATRGIAILADGGGYNTVISNGVATQGAAVMGAVGALLTWNSTNRFDANLPSNGLAQGAGATGGVGILAAFGAGADEYLAHGPGHVQGFGANLDTQFDSAPQTKAPGTGILLDAGGDNRFSAPEASAAQGASTGGLGILWSGAGNDQYNARARSQGSGSGTGVGILLDIAGDDAYHSGSQSQGAGTDGTGLLVDLGGHDQYGGASGVQGVGSGPAGFGLLVDASGRDHYKAQGTGQGASDCAGRGLFLDAQGRDRYAHGGEKRPAMDAQRPSDENDWTWMQPGSPDAVVAGNPSQAACMLGLGIDSEAIEPAISALRDLVANPLDPNAPTVQLQVESGGVVAPPAAGEGRVTGNVTLRAVVRNLADPEKLRRVSFFLDDAWEAEGNLVSFDPDAGVAEYEHLWDTSAGTFPDQPYPDRNYTVRAAAFVEPDPSRASPVGTPDLASYDSGDFVARVDNPPFLGATFSKAGTVLDEAILTPGGVPAILQVTVGGDLEWPLNETDERVHAHSDCEAGPVPGGYLAVLATGTGNVHPILEGYCAAGTHRFAIDGTTDGLPWSDGRYDLTVTVVDAHGAQTVRGFTILIDGLPPNSTILTPPIAGLDRLVGGNLRVHWGHSDQPADGAGVGEVYILQLDPTTLDVVERLGPYPAETTRLEQVQVPHNKTVALVTVAVDRAGNSEVECLLGEGPLDFGQGRKTCYLAKAGNATHILVDAIEPRVSDPVMTRPGLPPGSPFHAAVRPGRPVEFTLHAADDGSGVDEVLIRFFDSTGALAHEATMTDSRGIYRYDGWNTSNQADHAGIPQEGRFFFETTAFDLAGNQQSSGSSGILDSLPPRVDERTKYIDQGGQAREAGGPGVRAVIGVDVQDILAAGVTIDARPLGKPGAAVPCAAPEGDSTIHTCTLLLDGVADGTYHLRLNATDAAGNWNNATTATVVVSGQPLAIEHINVTRGHDWLLVQWQTPEEGTSIVELGRLPWDEVDGGEPTHVTQSSARPTTSHWVNVTGLTPSSTYFLRAVSESAGGVRNASALLSVRTLNAYTLDLSSLDGRILHGEVAMDYTLSMRSPKDEAPVAMRVLVQDAARTSSPVEVAPTFPQAPGRGTVLLDTTRFADGRYRAIAEVDRLGDFNRTMSAEFRIDNTAPIVTPVQPRPGTVISSSRPTIQVALIDPLGHAPPPTHALQVRIDDKLANITRVVEDAVSASGTRRVSFTVDRDLVHGNHTIEVTVADFADNREGTSWPFQVDTQPPTLEGQVRATPMPGPAATRPGGRMRVALDLEDPSTVAEVHLDLSHLGGQSIPLATLGNGRWQVETTIPAGAVAGTHLVPIRAKDALGNEGPVATAEVAVDDKPATVLVASVADTGFLHANIHLATDEPTVVHGADGTLHSPAWAKEHTFTVDNLTPGTHQPIVLNVTDRAGHVTLAQVDVDTPTDSQPPTAPANVAAASTQEGVVELSWSNATDNSAVRHYIVARSATERSPAMQAVVKQPGFRDLDAPAGRNAVYRITAFDAAGMASPGVDVVVRVLALPHLAHPSIAPLRAKATEPVTFEVEYRHASGTPAKAVWVRLGETNYPLTLASAPKCHEGCLYRAEVILPTSQLAGMRDAVFVADDGTNQDRLTVGDGPTVSLAGTGKGAAVDLDSARKDTPGLGAFTTLALLAFAASSRTRRPRP